MLGTVDPQAELLDAGVVCGHLVPEGSVYRRLAEVGERLFSDSDFADLYDPCRGRRSVPPSLLAKVLLLQSLEGTSDRETLERVRCDLRWKVALGLSLVEEGFHPSLLCYFRERLRRSEKPRRIFDRFKEVAREAGLLGDRGVRALDSTPVLSAVQTQDTVSLLRGALRRLLGSLGAEATDIEGRLERDDYHQVGKPPIDWDDPAAREALVDELVRDALGVLSALEGRELSPEVAEAAELLATVAGQDVEEVEGRFCIRRGVAADRVISVVDPEARHGRKSRHGHFDGYKAHVAVDPETELVTEVVVTAGNVADAEAATRLLPELEGTQEEDPDPPADERESPGDGEPEEEAPALTVVADSAYGSGATRAALTQRGARLFVKAPPEQNTHGGFPKSAFVIDLEERTATCPAGVTTTVFLPAARGGGRFRFPAQTCASCPLRDRCTSSGQGRTLTVGPYEALLAEARALQATDHFKHIYRGKRPTVERVISRQTRNGGRKARYRGQDKIEAQQRLKAAAENLARMFRLGLTWHEGSWVIA